VSVQQTSPIQGVANHLLVLRSGRDVAVLKRTHLEEGQGHAGRRRSCVGWIHALHGQFQRFPVQNAGVSFPKVVRRSDGRYKAQKWFFHAGRHLHVCIEHLIQKPGVRTLKGFTLLFRPNLITRGYKLHLARTGRWKIAPYLIQMAEVAVPRELFRAILEGIGRLRLPTVLSGC